MGPAPRVFDSAGQGGASKFLGDADAAGPGIALRTSATETGFDALTGVGLSVSLKLSLLIMVLPYAARNQTVIDNVSIVLLAKVDYHII